MMWPHIDWVRLFNVPLQRAALPKSTSRSQPRSRWSCSDFPRRCAARYSPDTRKFMSANSMWPQARWRTLLGLFAGIALRVSMPVLFVLATGWIVFANWRHLLVCFSGSKPWLRPSLSAMSWRCRPRTAGLGFGILLFFKLPERWYSALTMW